MPEQPDTPEGRQGGLFSSVKRLVGTLASTLHNRAELFAVELQEEGMRLVGTLLLAGAIVLFSGLAMIVGIFAMLLAVGEEHRFAAAIIMTLILLTGAAGSAWWLALRLKNWSAFPGTRAELRKDREWLQSNQSRH
jgi:uncharacterized membrane protein YqjE